MSNIKHELDKIKECISATDFITNMGKSNELGIHVFCYDPADELVVRDYISRLTATHSDDYRIIEYDLYKIFLEILEDKRILDKIEGMEEKRGRKFVLDHLHRTIGAEKEKQSYYEYLSRMDYEPHQLGDVVFLTGIGKVYPFVRAHIILNAMQKMFTDVPILMFYPGSFNQQDLILFNKIHDGNYYRAFNLL